MCDIQMFIGDVACYVSTENINPPDIKKAGYASLYKVMAYPALCFLSLALIPAIPLQLQR